MEIKDYIDGLLEEKINESMNMFQPNDTTIDSYVNSLEPYRKELGQNLGYPPPKSMDGKVTKIVNVGEDKYCTIYRIWIEVIEGVNTYGICMVPKNIAHKAPLIIAMHGGGGNPEAICDLDTRINYRSFGHEAVKRGYIIWAPGLTMLSNYSGDTKIAGADRGIFDKELNLLGSSIIGLEIHKIIESTKVLVGEFSEIDQTRVGMTGLSWGGFFTMYTTALFPMVKVAAPSGYFRDTEADLRNTIDVESDTKRIYLFKGFGHFQAIGLICPRPCMVQLGENDPLFELAGARKEADKASQYYEKLGIGDKFTFKTHSGGHEFDTVDILDFMDEFL
jgi:dienelactone hydrolase